MPTYRVCFDGKWQGSFRDRQQAFEWARAMGETGRLVHVVRNGVLRSKLIAIFPPDRDEEGRLLWKIRSAGAGMPVGIGGS